MELKDRLQQLIKQRNIMQKDLVEVLNTTPQTISRYVKGEREPNIKTLKLLAKYFKVSVDYLIGYEDEE